MTRKRVLIGIGDVVIMLNVHRSRAHVITQRVAAGREPFPRPVAVLANGRVWDQAAVRRWIERNRPPAEASK